MVQLSHPYTMGKTIALTIWTFVSEAMSLFFNMLPRSVIAFIPRSKHLLMSWLQSFYAVILESKKIKPITFSTFSPSICHDVMGSDAISSLFECWVLSKLFHSSLSPSSGGSLVPLPYSLKYNCVYILNYPTSLF